MSGEARYAEPLERWIDGDALAPVNRRSKISTSLSFISCPSASVETRMLHQLDALFGNGLSSSEIKPAPERC